MAKKIKLTIGKKEQEIELKNPKGKHMKKGLKLLFKIDSAESEVIALDEYMDYVDEISSELTGLSIEQLDELEEQDKEQITGYYNGKIRGKIDFLMSSLRQPSSVQKATKE